ncbi:MAG TPA: sigma-54 dependent transcriptional regulator [Thermoanaerobaculia bacterium]|nr:sigma-54 dependent transcriptional regulator [Thermoanaerobaculia bacterium]
MDRPVPPPATAPRRVLIVDDEPSVRFGVSDFLRGRGFLVEEAESVRQAEEAFRKAPPAVAVVDYSLPDGNALELLPRLKELDPTVPVLILTAHGSVDLAVRAIKEGAEQFLTKPVQLEALTVIVDRLIENQRNRQQQMARRSRLSRELRDPFLGTSAAIRALAAEARKVAASDSPVLIQGETGAGKGVLARWLHESGPRAEEPFVDLNCAGLSREFLETELFGHEKGAFTGATAAKPGLLEVAHRGTIFLDEVGDVDAQVQPKLLKVLEEKQFRRIGDVRDRRVDIRLVTATHQNLAELVREKRFRNDLFFRINTVPLRVPGLRERAEDVPALAEQILEGLAARWGYAKVALSDDASEALKGHSWPGNIRELRNVLERAVLLSGSPVIERRDLRFEAAEPTAAPYDLDRTLIEVERQHIERMLRAEGGRVEAAARRLGIPRSSLYQKIKRFGIEVGKRN